MLFCAVPSHPDYVHYQALEKAIGKFEAQAYLQDNAGVMPKSSEEVEAIKNYHEVSNGARTNLVNKDEILDLKTAIEKTKGKIAKINEVYKDLTNEERVIQRVSDIIEEYKRLMGREWVGGDDDFYALKGTVIHQYLEEINKATFSEVPVNYFEINQAVRKQLQNHTKFEGKNSEFFSITPAQFNVLAKSTKELYNSLININNKIKKENNLDGDLTAFTEVTVFDEVSDVAGTIDLVVQFADGSVAVYDYKSLLNLKESTQSLSKQTDWALQMSNYVNMLKNNYGVTSVRQARIIPIGVQYKAEKQDDGNYKRIEDGFKTLAMYNSSNKAELLKPLATAEETTGDKNIDELVAKLEQQRQDLIGKQKIAKGKSKQIELQSSIRSLTRAINDILVENDTNKILSSIESIKSRYMDRLGISSTKENYIEDMELVEGYQEISVYENLSVFLKEQLDSLKKTMKASEYQVLKGKVNNLSNELSELKQDMFQEIVNRSGGDNLLKEGQGISSIGKMMHGLDNWQIPIFQKLREIYSTAQEGARVDTERKYKRISELNEKLQKWGKRNGYTGEKLYKLFYNDKTGNLHTKYNEEFTKKFSDYTYRARRYKTDPSVKELTAEEKAWLDKYFTIDKDAVEQARNLLVKDLKNQLARKEINKDEYKERIDLFDKYSNPLTTKDAFYRGNNEYNERVFVVPSKDAEGFLSKEYEFIQKNEPLKEYYDMYTDIISEYREEYGWKVIGDNFVPIVHQDMTDLLARKGLSGIPEIIETARQKFKIREQDEVVGSIVNGKKVKSIPLLYVENLRTSLSKKEQAELEAEISFPAGSKQYKNELSRKIRQKEYEKGLTNKSTDLTKSLMLFVATANEHRFLSKVEPMVQSLQVIVNSDKMILKNKDNNARIAYNKWMGKVQEYMGVEPDLAKAFNTFVDRLIYKQEFTNGELFSSDKYSTNKVLKSMMNFFSTSAIGGNLILVMSNYLTARNNLWMMSMENTHFDKKGWDTSLKWYGKQDERFERVYDYIQPTSRDYLREKAEAQGVNFRSRVFRSQTLFIGHIVGDDRIDAALAVAMSLKYRVDSDGTIKNPDLPGQQLINPDAPTVADSILRDKDGMTYIPGVSFKEFSLYRDKVRKMGQRIKGMTNEKQKGLIYSTMLGSMFMHLRSWLPGMATTRFGRLEFDETLGSLEQGRFSVAFGEIVHKGFLPTIKEFSKFLTEAIAMGYYKREVNMEVIQAKYKQFITANPEYRSKLTVDDFVKMHKNKMQAFAAELRIYMAFFLAVQLLGGLDWDDDEEGNLFSWNAHQVMRRALLELSFWLSPSAAGDIIKSPLPILGLVERIGSMLQNSIVQTSYIVRGERDDTNDKYLGYYVLKTIPAVNQFMNLFRIFEPYRQERTTFEKVFYEE